MQHGLLTEATDLSPADWVTERMTTFAENVASIIPSGFEAYARIFHPAYRTDGEALAAVRWSDVANATGRTVHPEMQWEGVSGVPLDGQAPHSGIWDEGPLVGNLPRELMETLVGLVRPHTSTPSRVWFCRWNGWGNPVPLRSNSRSWVWKAAEWLRPRRGSEQRSPTVNLPGREYYLLSGPLEGALATMGSAVVGRPVPWESFNLWWPDDRAWFVSTEIDFAWTYVGGSAALIRQVLESPHLEALPAELSHRATYDSDLLNPPPEPRKRNG